MREWHCPRCGRQWVTEDDMTVAHFHFCDVKARGSIRPGRSRDEIRHEERMLWAKQLLGAELEASILARDGEDVLLRRVDDEEAVP